MKPCEWAIIVRSMVPCYTQPTWEVDFGDQTFHLCSDHISVIQTHTDPVKNTEFGRRLLASLGEVDDTRT
jgi:hypothetical protein